MQDPIRRATAIGRRVHYDLSSNHTQHLHFSTSAAKVNSLRIAQGGTMSWNNRPSPSPAPPAPNRPRWARKRVVIPAAAALLFVGVGIGGADGADAKTAARAKPAPTVTVTVTAKPAQIKHKAEPTPTVTVTRTVTAKPRPKPTPKPKVTRSAGRGPGLGGGPGPGPGIRAPGRPERPGARAGPTAGPRRGARTGPFRTPRTIKAPARITAGSPSSTGDTATGRATPARPVGVVTRLRAADYSGGVGVSWLRYIAWMSSSSLTVGPTTAMPRASMLRQFSV